MLPRPHAGAGRNVSHHARNPMECSDTLQGGAVAIPSFCCCYVPCTDLLSLLVKGHGELFTATTTLRTTMFAVCRVAGSPRCSKPFAQAPTTAGNFAGTATAGGTSSRTASKPTSVTFAAPCISNANPPCQSSTKQDGHLHADSVRAVGRSIHREGSLNNLFFEKIMRDSTTTMAMMIPPP